jgi:hypothetical protein
MLTLATNILTYPQLINMHIHNIPILTKHQVQRAARKQYNVLKRTSKGLAPKARKSAKGKPATK